MKPSLLFSGSVIGILLLSKPVLAQTPAASPNNTNTKLRASGVTTKASLANSLPLSPDHTTLLQLLEKSGLSKQATGKTQYTVFAPTNAAFSTLDKQELRQMLLPSSQKRLIQFLAYHVVKGRLTSDQLKDGQTLTNLMGRILVIHKQGDDITVRDERGIVADVTQANIRTTNGVVYSINKVLQRNIPMP
jgi:uncharacterized surface protein with fasciclin (FAS1) repeats